MLADLAQALGCALITVRRLLRQTGYFRSYTHNAKWYSIPDSPQFNREGIWHHRGIGFSKHGSLTATILYFVARSPAGLSARELAETLQHPCHAVLTHLHKDAELDRVRVASQFRYLCTEQPMNRRQREQSAVQQPPSPSTPLSAQAAVLVLVEYIKNPELSFEQLAAHLHKQGHLTVAAENIRRFFAEHSLKKTPETPTPGP